MLLVRKIGDEHAQKRGNVGNRHTYDDSQFLFHIIFPMTTVNPFSILFLEVSHAYRIMQQPSPEISLLNHPLFLPLLLPVLRSYNEGGCVRIKNIWIPLPQLHFKSQIENIGAGEGVRQIKVEFFDCDSVFI